MSVKFSSKTIGSLFSGGTGGTFRQISAVGIDPSICRSGAGCYGRQLRGLGAIGTWTIFYRIDGSNRPETSIRVDAETEREAINAAVALISRRENVSPTAVMIENVLTPVGRDSDAQAKLRGNRWIKPVAIGGAVVVGAFLLLGKKRGRR